MSQLQPTCSHRHFGSLFATPTLAHAQTFDRCVACAWLLSDERELVNLLARGANIIAFGICKECFTG